MGFGRRIGAIASTVGLATVGVLVAAPAADAAAPAPQVFSYAGSGVAQTYVVPAGVTAVQLQLFGGQGGQGGTCQNCGAGGRGGLGAEVLTSLQVTPGERLTIVVGGRGQAGGPYGLYTASGGGGGGMSAVSVLGTPEAIAGGGGGGGAGGRWHFSSGIHAHSAGGRGGDSGQKGYTSASPCAGYGGLAGPIPFGGSGGHDAYCVSGATGAAGSGIQGGAGGAGAKDANGSASAGGQGGQGALGGGGGGGGGASNNGYTSVIIVGVGGGGGGGTSSHFANPGLVLDGVSSGNGEVIVTPLLGSAPGKTPPGRCSRPHPGKSRCLPDPKPRPGAHPCKSNHLSPA